MIRSHWIRSVRRSVPKVLDKCVSVGAGLLVLTSVQHKIIAAHHYLMGLSIKVGGKRRKTHGLNHLVSWLGVGLGLG